MDDSSGHVEPGGPALSRTVDIDGVAVEIRTLSVSEMDNNVYLLRDVEADEALLVDAADDAERILGEIGETRVVAIATTHGHWDHWRALDAVREATGAPAHLHPADRDMVEATIDADLADDGRIAFGRVAVRLIHTPGHTPGSTCLLLGERHVFTGDTLFPGGPGGTFGDDAAFRRIIASLRERLFALDDETHVYPGHGDETTIGAERPALAEWEARGW
jgi:glyoxylase-like metal-dependent hydrolase (beta-lactamase superfamily II)